MLLGPGKPSSKLAKERRVVFSFLMTSAKRAEEFGFDIVNEQFGGFGGGQPGSIVFEAEDGVLDPGVQAAMSTFIDEIRAETIEGGALPTSISPDRTTELQARPSCARTRTSSLSPLDNCSAGKNSSSVSERTPLMYQRYSTST